MGISWTDEQKSVINSRHGNLLVSAAAGSGKTAVLVERILEMVMGVDADGNKAEEKIDIDEVLVVTFTRAAAAQMKEKIADKLEQAAEDHPEDEHIVKQLSLAATGRYYDDRQFLPWNRKRLFSDDRDRFLF